MTLVMHGGGGAEVFQDCMSNRRLVELRGALLLFGSYKQLLAIHILLIFSEFRLIKDDWKCFYSAPLRRLQKTDSV